MSPYKTPDERTKNNGFGHWKSEIYNNDKMPLMFVESEIHQARTIFLATNRPVFCADTMEIYGDYKIQNVNG